MGNTGAANMATSNREILPNEESDAKSTSELPFHLMDLPTELRLMIYRKVLIRPEHIRVQYEYHDTHGQGKKLRTFKRPLVDYNRCELAQPALTMVSHKIRNECLPIFYGENTFIDPHWGLSNCDYFKRTYCNFFGVQITSAHGYGTGPWYLPKWLHQIGGKNRALLKHIAIHCCEISEDYSGCHEDERHAERSRDTAEWLNWHLDFWDEVLDTVSIYICDAVLPEHRDSVLRELDVLKEAIPKARAIKAAELGSKKVNVWVGG